jgi:hypothetical protein
MFIKMLFFVHDNTNIVRIRTLVQGDLMIVMQMILHDFSEFIILCQIVNTKTECYENMDQLHFFGSSFNWAVFC